TVIENISMHGTLTHQFNENLIGALQVRHFKSRFDEFSTSPFLSLSPITDGTSLQVRGHLPARINELTIDGSVTSTFSTGSFDHTLIAGVTYDDTNYRAASGFDLINVLGPYDYVSQRTPLSFGDVPALDSFLQSDYKTAAAYAQDHIRFTDQISVLLGGRFSQYELKEIEGGQGTDETFTHFDPRIGLTFQIIDGFSVFSGWSNGSRLSLFFVGDNGAPPDLETSQSLEVGVKFGLSELGLSGTLAGFQNTRKNVPTPDPTTFTSSLQTGEQEAIGAEIDLVWEPSQQLSVLVSAAYADSEVTEDNAIPIGDELPRVPEYSGRIAGRYRFDGPLEGFGVGAGATFASGAETTLPNSFRSDAYAIIDAQASYAFDRFKVGVAVQNLTDASYFSPYQYLAQPVLRPGTPRTAYVTLTANF
ncbi:MAG: TonB-dependent receptor, partial [Pseudomonadota bacterium]